MDLSYAQIKRLYKKKKIIAKKTWQDPNKRQIEFKDVPQYIIRQAWLGEGYLCSYRDRDGNLQVYMITMPFMSETRIRLIITKAGITPEDKKLPMGKKKKLPYGEESEFHDLEEI